MICSILRIVRHASGKSAYIPPADLRMNSPRHIADEQSDLRAESFYRRTVIHELIEGLQIGIRIFPNGLVPLRRLHIGAYRPHIPNVLLGIFIEQPAQIQFCRFRVLGLFQNGRALRPGDEAVFFRQGELRSGIGIGFQRAISRKCDRIFAGFGLIGGRLCAANKMRFLFHQLRQPLPAVAVNRLFVPEQHRVIVIGIGGDNFAFEGWIQIISCFARRLDVAQCFCIGEIAKGIDKYPGPGAIIILEVFINRFPANRLVRQQYAFGFPARKILQRLQLHHVSDDGFIGNLIIDAGVVYFAVIDHGIERNAGESFFKSGLDAILLFRSITTGINDELAASFKAA